MPPKDLISQSIIPTSQSEPTEDAYLQALRAAAIEKYRADYGTNLSNEDIVKVIIWSSDLNKDQLKAYLGPHAPNENDFPQATAPEQLEGMIVSTVPDTLYSLQHPAQVPAKNSRFRLHNESDSTTAMPALPTFISQPEVIIQPNGEKISPLNRHGTSIDTFHRKILKVITPDSESATETIADTTKDPILPQPQPPLPAALEISSNSAVAHTNDDVSFRIDHTNDKDFERHALVAAQSVLDTSHSTEAGGWSSNNVPLADALAVQMPATATAPNTPDTPSFNGTEVVLKINH